MSPSPLKRLLLCFCILTVSVVMIAPRTAYASPGIWDWFKWGMRIGGNINELKNMDIDWWVSHAGMATTNFAYRIITGCDHDTLLWCASQDPAFPAAEDVAEGEPNCDPCNPEGSNATAFMGGGAFGYASAAIEGMSEINPPFSLALYAQDLTQDTILGGKVHADIADDAAAWAVGWVGKYYQDIFKEATFAFWKQIRNLAYLLFVIILIAMGFMVMLRYQVSPRTTVTVTAALPRVAVGLVLITFSYAVISLAVDLIIPLTIVARRVVASAWVSIATENSFFASFVPWLSSSGITGEILGTIAAIFSRRINLFSVLLCLVILVAVLITLFLAFWAFLKRFIGLIYMGILGPLIIAWGTLPGNEEAITGWFKKIIVSVLALPSIVLVMNAGLVIMMLNPPSSDAFPLPIAFLTDLTAQLITFIIGLSILWQAHKVPDALDAALSGGGNRR